MSLFLPFPFFFISFHLLLLPFVLFSFLFVFHSFFIHFFLFLHACILIVTSTTFFYSPYKNWTWFPFSLFICYTIRYNFGRVTEFSKDLFTISFISRRKIPLHACTTLRINRPNDLLTLFLQFVPITMFSYPIYGQQNNFRNGFKTRRMQPSTGKARSIQRLMNAYRL